MSSPSLSSSSSGINVSPPTYISALLITHRLLVENIKSLVLLTFVALLFEVPPHLLLLDLFHCGGMSSLALLLDSRDFVSLGIMTGFIDVCSAP